MTTLVDYTARFLNTADALDYTIHEIDDLTSRKVEAVEVDGDTLARVVRARRGAARAIGDVDPYANTTDNGDFNLWDASGWPTTERAISDRRMVMIGHGHPFARGGGYATRAADVPWS